MTVSEMWSFMLKGIKQAVETPKGGQTIWQREWTTYQALDRVLGQQPCTLGGYYSWLTSPLSERPLQIDLFYPRIAEISGVVLNVPRCLAVEVQSSLHDGKWNASKKHFFRSREAFERYCENQEWKRLQLQQRGIPFLEIDPAVDNLAPQYLRKALGDIFHIVL